MPLAGQPFSAYRTLKPLPERWAPRAKAIARPSLSQFVFLSMLLHALAIALFGAPSGGSREGRALWGSIQVVLQASPRDEGPALKLDRGVRMERRVEPTASPTAAPRAKAPRVEAPISMPPLLDRVVSPDLKLERLPPLRVPPPTELQATPAPAPVAPAPIPAPPDPPAADERPAPRVERVPAEAPLIPLQPLLQPIPMPSIERLATPPAIERVPIETPAVPVTAPTPPVERAPVEVPAIPVPTLESIAPPRSDPAAKPVEQAPVREMPISPPLPPALERAAPQGEAPTVPQREAPAKIDRDTPMKTEPALRPSPFTATLPSHDASRDRRPEPSTTYDPTAPALDLDAVRKRAAEITREGSGRRAILPFPMPPKPERKTKEQIAIEKALKPDCRTAYQGLGLAAIVPLIANEFGEGNCRW